MWREDKGSSHWSHRSSNEKLWCIFSASCDALEIDSQDQTELSTRSDALWFVTGTSRREDTYVTGAPLSHSGHTDLAALAERHWPLPPRLGGEDVLGGERTLMSSVMFSPSCYTRVTSSNIMIMGRDVLGSNRTLTLQVYQLLITKVTSSK